METSLDDISSKKHGRKLTILLIEDELIALRVHKTYLEKMGFNVDIGRTGEEAFTLYKNNNYPLVILDGGLPDITGKDLSIHIREYERSTGRSRTPLILLSGYLEEKIKQWCVIANIDAYAIKPVQADFLKELIMRYINI